MPSVSRLLIRFLIHPCARFAATTLQTFSELHRAVKSALKRTIGVGLHNLITKVLSFTRSMITALTTNDALLWIGLDVATLVMRITHVLLQTATLVVRVIRVLLDVATLVMRILHAIMPHRSYIWKLLKRVFRVFIQLSSEICFNIKIRMSLAIDALQRPDTQSLSFARLYRYYEWSCIQSNRKECVQKALRCWLMMRVLKDRALYNAITKDLSTVEGYSIAQDGNLSPIAHAAQATFGSLVCQTAGCHNHGALITHLMTLLDRDWEALDRPRWESVLQLKDTVIHKIRALSTPTECANCYEALSLATPNVSVARQTKIKITQELLERHAALTRDENTPLVPDVQGLEARLKDLANKIADQEQATASALFTAMQTAALSLCSALSAEHKSLAVTVLDSIAIPYKGCRKDLLRNRLIQILTTGKSGLHAPCGSQRQRWPAITSRCGGSRKHHADGITQLPALLAELARLHAEQERLVSRYADHGVACQLSHCPSSFGPRRERTPTTYHVFTVIPLSSGDKERLALSGMDMIRRKIMEREDMPDRGRRIDWRVVFIDASFTGQIAQDAYEIADRWYSHYLQSENVVFINARSCERKPPGSRRHGLEGSFGKGKAIKWGFRWCMDQIKAQGLAPHETFVFFEDSKTDTNSGYLVSLLSAMLTRDCPVAVGSRNLPDSFTAVKPAYGFLLSALYNLFVSIALPPLGRLRDTQCGLKGFRADVLADLLPLLQEPQWSIDTEMLLLSRLLGHQIVEVPVGFVDSKGPLGYRKSQEFITDSLAGVKRQRRDWGIHPFAQDGTRLWKIGNGIEADVYGHPATPAVRKREKSRGSRALRMLMKLMVGADHEIRPKSFDVPWISCLLASEGTLGKTIRGFIQQHKSFAKGLTAAVECQERDMSKGYELAIERMPDLIPHTEIEYGTCHVSRWWGTEELPVCRLIVQRRVTTMLQDVMRDAIDRGDLEAAKGWVKEFFVFQHRMWARGCFDHNLKMLDDIGIDEQGNLVLVDAGELIGSQSDALLELQPTRLQEKLRRFDAQYFQALAPVELVDYYQRQFDRYMDPAKLRRLWATRRVDTCRGTGNQ